MNRFGVMLDMSRNGVMKPKEVVNYARIIKSLGYNMIELYTEDTYEVENEPYFGYLRGRYSIEEQKYIVDECEKIGVEVIPCIQTLAHLNQIFRWQKYIEMRDINDILLAEDDKTYALIENMLKTISKIYKSKYIHIGMDEAHMLGLGEYLNRHGFKNRFEILNTHLEKVIALCKKYNLTPTMWSDMFFRLGNKGEYYSENPEISKDVVEKTPKDVDLVFWDYYHTNKNLYDKMIEAHQMFNNEIWFAGGAWTWTGFVPGNRFSLDTMKPAMLSCKEHGINNIFITMWGDNGKECSYYSALPALFAIRKFYDGQTNMEVISKEFKEITGENFEDMMDLDLPNLICGNTECTRNPSKHMLYSDLFTGFLDSSVKEGGCEDYKKYAKILKEKGQNSKNYGYIFDCLSSLCSVLEIKYNMGVRIRKAYKNDDKVELAKICGELDKMLERIDEFYNKFAILWYKECKPHGFDVQDLRIGGLIQRVKACKNRLEHYVDGSYKNIPELEEEILGWFGKEGDPEEDKIPCFNGWMLNSSVNVL